ncbi:tetratricopeptide repeat protein [Dysgonomonas sp. 520]|nr:tetratricopeptide repeat protein [Dysgonomonas sp. 520]
MSFSSVKAQDLLDEANDLFNEKKYAEAIPYFEKIYGAHSSDPTVNLQYGVSLLNTKQDLSKTVELFQKVDKKKQPEVHLYLGDVYAALYRFSDAEKEYSQYATVKRRDKAALSVVEDRRKDMEVVKRFVNRTENIQIIDSIVVDKSDLLSAYKLSPGGGSLKYFDEVFDANVKVNSTVYFNEKGSRIYFGQPMESFYSLYSMDKLIDGYGNEKELDKNKFGLSGNVNYVFVMTDGVTTYFSAEDEKGMGGYDLYVTRYNMNNDSYLTPERLNMPFNSPFNDYLMVIDEEKGVGWFATDRYQQEGKVCVYTFIPNKEVSMIESEDETYLANRARISSIKDTWLAEVDYSQLKVRANKVVVSENTPNYDFEFVINDRITYYFYNDFKNAKAKNLYSSAREKKAELAKVENELNEQRNAYATVSGGNKSVMSSEILRLEKLQEQLEKEVSDLEINARNAEIESLNK